MPLLLFQTMEYFETCMTYSGDDMCLSDGKILYKLLQAQLHQFHGQ